MSTRGLPANMADTERRAAGSTIPDSIRHQPLNENREQPNLGDPPRRNLVKRTLPEFVRFEHRGDAVKGTLLQIGKAKMQDGGTALCYTVAGANGNYKFLGTYDIDSKLRVTDEGKYIEVTFLGVDDATKTKGNAMKLFEVEVEEKIQRVRPTEITDEDIPF